jgi:hypothetical protein
VLSLHITLSPSAPHWLALAATVAFPSRQVRGVDVTAISEPMFLCR